MDLCLPKVGNLRYLQAFRCGSGVRLLGRVTLSVLAEANANNETYLTP